jgi:hypothetical protein
MELVLPTSISHPPSTGMCQCSHVVYPLPKAHLKVKKIANFRKITFLIKKMEIVFGKFLLGNSEL